MDGLHAREKPLLSLKKIFPANTSFTLKGYSTYGKTDLGEFKHPINSLAITTLMGYSGGVAHIQRFHSCILYLIE
jgi:hypothetical protein